MERLVYLVQGVGFLIVIFVTIFIDGGKLDKIRDIQISIFNFGIDIKSVDPDVGSSTNLPLPKIRSA